MTGCVLLRPLVARRQSRSVSGRRAARAVWSVGRGVTSAAVSGRRSPCSGTRRAAPVHLEWRPGPDCSSAVFVPLHCDRRRPGVSWRRFPPRAPNCGRQCAICQRPRRHDETAALPVLHSDNVTLKRNVTEGELKNLRLCAKE